MPRIRKIPPPPRSHHWYLAEWAAERKRRQADAIRDLGWSRSSASDLWTGKQRYTQDHIDEVARWLEVEPYELLLPPREALALRQMRRAAHTIAAEDGVAFEGAPPQKTGTQG